PLTWNGILLPATTATQYQFDTILVNSNANCDVWKILSVEVQSVVTPSFNINTDFCSQTSVSPLSNTSTNGITGTWSPAFSNQISNTYTFTPDVSFCASTAAVSIQVSQPIVPTFNIPSTLCAGSPNPLPTMSTNGVEGVWAPQFDANQSGSYTF